MNSYLTKGPPDAASRSALAANLECAVALHQRGELAQARAIYQDILRAQPHHFDALHMLGVLAAMSGEPGKAVRLIGRAIEVNPSSAIALNNRGLARQELRDYQAALRDHERALAIDARYAEAHCERGNALKGLKRWEEALASYERAITLRPDYELAIFNCGVVLMDLKRWDAALRCFDRALELKPDYAEAHNGRGNVLCALRCPERALASYERALALKPHYAAADCNRAVALHELVRWEEAVEGCNRAISLQSDYAEAYLNRGAVLRSMHQVEAAIASFDEAIALQPKLVTAHVNRSMALLLQGDFKHGWQEYEWRLRDTVSASPRRSACRRWRGDDSLVGKTIVLHAEQGFGDTIQFCRYVTLLAERGARVILEAPKQLASLLASLEGLAQVLVPGEPLPASDRHCELLSLPLAFGTTLGRVPARVPYLRSSAPRRRHFVDKLGERSKPRVGLVWSSGVRPNQPQLWSAYNRRNISLAKLACLKHPGVEFYSLQKGQPAESELADSIARGWDGPQLKDFTGDLHDFDDTAALIGELDLVISVDTSTAHLAGALGKPVWILLCFDACWRWLLERTDSPWYPTARLYRQPQPGDWEAVIRNVRRDLDAWVAGRT